MDLSEHRQSIAEALESLEASLGHLVAALAHDALWARIDGATTDAQAVRLACDAYTKIDYGMEDPAGESVVCLGVVGGGSDVVRLAEAVNAAKAELKRRCTPLQGIRVRIPVKRSSSATQAIAAIRVVLRNIQRSDLNLLAAYRKIPILTAPPSSVTFTRANTRAVYRKSIEAIQALLVGRDSPTAAADRERLALLDRRETHLALVKERYQNIRANVLYAHLDPRGRGRMQISAELPLVYARGRRVEVPAVRFPVPAAVNAPRRVRQSKLEPQPFLESLPVYRYARSTR